MIQIPINFVPGFAVNRYKFAKVPKKFLSIISNLGNSSFGHLPTHKWNRKRGSLNQRS